MNVPPLSSSDKNPGGNHLTSRALVYLSARASHSLCACGSSAGDEASQLNMELFWILFFSVLQRFTRGQGVYGKNFAQIPDELTGWCVRARARAQVVLENWKMLEEVRCEWHAI